MLKTIDPKKFNTLIEISNLINSNFSDLDALLTQILDSAMRLCQGDASSLLLVRHETEELHFQVALGAKGSEVKEYTVKLGEGIAGWVAAHNRSMIVNDVESEKRHRKDIAESIGYPSKTMLAAPLRLMDECIGVIEILNKKDGKYFTPEDLEWLEIFTNQAALAIANARHYRRARDQIDTLQHQINKDKGFHIFVSQSPLIAEKLEMIERVAKTDSSVLLLGESGVGKELFAEQIHQKSLRADAPFVRVNCAAIPEGLLESELFGHVKGAFTNAVADRKGRFEAADGGTIFLDEIGDMPLALQAKLLRVIQQRTFEKVGSDKSVTVDTRILAATNKDIEALVEKGAFRSDLYYRLNVLPIYIPPLRQRPEDITALADFFLEKYSASTHKRFSGFTDDAIEEMLSYSWPGNVRELQNSIERACVIGKNETIGARDLFVKGVIEDEEDDGDRSLKNAVNVFKARFVRKVLDENNWNQTDTAKALDIQRTYLSKLVKELGIKEQ